MTTDEETPTESVRGPENATSSASAGLQCANVASLSASDVGMRVVVIDESGNAYDGILTTVWAQAWEYAKTPAEKVRTRIEVAADEGSNLKLTNLPLDFRLQIERIEAGA